MAKAMRKGQSGKARKNGLKYGKSMRKNDNRVARRSAASELRNFYKRAA